MQTNRQASKPCVHTQTVLIRGQAWLKVSLRFCHQGNPAKTNPTAGCPGLGRSSSKLKPHTAKTAKGKMSQLRNRCHTQQQLAWAELHHVPLLCSPLLCSPLLWGACKQSNAAISQRTEGCWLTCWLSLMDFFLTIIQPRPKKIWASLQGFQFLILYIFYYITSTKYTKLL